MSVVGRYVPMISYDCICIVSLLLPLRKVLLLDLDIIPFRGKQNKNTWGEASVQQKPLAVEHLLLDEAVFWSCSHSMQMFRLVVFLLDPSPLDFGLIWILRREMGGCCFADSWRFLVFNPLLLIQHFFG